MDHWHIKCKFLKDITKKEAQQIKKAIYPYIDKRGINIISQMKSLDLYDFKLTAIRYAAPWHLIPKYLESEKAINCPKCNSFKCDIEKDYTNENYYHCYECGEFSYNYKMYIV